MLPRGALCAAVNERGPAAAAEAGVCLARAGGRSVPTEHGPRTVRLSSLVQRQKQFAKAP